MFGLLALSSVLASVFLAGFACGKDELLASAALIFAAAGWCIVWLICTAKADDA